VRSDVDLQAAVDRAIDELGHVDIMLANAGVANYFTVQAMAPAAWRELIEINLTGVFNALHAVLPHMVERRYGRVIATSSTLGRTGAGVGANYAASKWGVIGLVKSAALEVGHAGVTVNAVAPGTVNTPLVQNDEIYRLFCPELENPTWEETAPRFAAQNPMGVQHLEVQDISAAVAFLASDEARYITGSVLDVNAGKSGHWSA
jgi:NAD(P)-dependent dehydrogenase (short-subunit alcohol dehydrogenase family)